MTNDAELVLDYFKRQYWPRQNRCNQQMAIQNHGHLPTTVVADGLTELMGLGLVVRGELGAFCLTDDGVRAIGGTP